LEALRAVAELQDANLAATLVLNLWGGVDDAIDAEDGAGAGAATDATTEQRAAVQAHVAFAEVVRAHNALPDGKERTGSGGGINRGAVDPLFRSKASKFGAHLGQLGRAAVVLVAPLPLEVLCKATKLLVQVGKVNGDVVGGSDVGGDAAVATDALGAVSGSAVAVPDPCTSAYLLRRLLLHHKMGDARVVGGGGSGGVAVVDGSAVDAALSELVDWADKCGAGREHLLALHSQTT
jgi:hypothetical protein